MRQVTDHKIEIPGARVLGVDNALTINVLDEPGHGNACHEYQIVNTVHNVEYLGKDEAVSIINRVLCQISFQNGPALEAGINGITQEALIAICIDRLRGFQSGDFACESNALALEHLELALGCLQQRTRDRLARGVEGRLVH
jgi:hypothetical protein